MSRADNMLLADASGSSEVLSMQHSQAESKSSEPRGLNELTGHIGVGLLALSLFTFSGCGREAGGAPAPEVAKAYYDRGNGVFFIPDGPGTVALLPIADNLSAFRKDHPDLKIVEKIQDTSRGAGATGLILITEPSTKVEDSAQ